MTVLDQDFLIGVPIALKRIESKQMPIRWQIAAQLLPACITTLDRSVNKDVVPGGKVEEQAASMAVRYADALIAELIKSNINNN